MMNSTTEIINELIDYYCEGVDTYNYNGSTWLIFTEEKKWVIELNNHKTLWYNYNFFTSCFKYLSLDVVENQHYITKWVEQNIIENGIKHTEEGNWLHNDERIADTIENGVKKTLLNVNKKVSKVEDTIQNGVKHVEDGDWLDYDERINDIIKNGIKITKPIDYSDNTEHIVEGVLSRYTKQEIHK